MQKVLGLMVFILLLGFVFTSCDYIPNLPGAQPEKEDIITVEDGYLVVNGVKTEYKVDTTDVVTVEDGYLVVNGVKTEHKVHSEPVISVIDGYVAINGVKTEYKVDTTDVITVENGYLVVNGVKTEYEVEISCNHEWQTVTTQPTCTEEGYDIKTCSFCNKSVRTNVIEATSHKYPSNYMIDNEYHWLVCTACDAIKDKEFHSPDGNGVCTVCQTSISETPGVIYDVSSDGTYAEVIGYEGTATNVKIASEYQGLPVKSIYDYAFAGENITALIIPEGVKTIGKSSFTGCENLTYISIPSSITDIGAYAFMAVTSANIYITDLSSWCNISRGQYAIDFGYNLYIDNELATNIVISNNVISINKDTFYRCHSLVSVIISENITVVEDEAFRECDNLTSVTIMGDKIVIGRQSFYDCSNLESVTFAKNIVKIDNRAFYNCSKLNSVTIPGCLNSLGEDAFYNCPGVTISEYENGKYLSIGSNPYFAFIEPTNDNMSSYTIHKDTKIICDAAFSNCSRLANIYYEGSEAEWQQIYICSDNAKLTSANIICNYVP